jgi:hypothetical protein
MGVDTHLYISNRFSIEDVKTLLECHLDGKDVKIEHTHTPEMSLIAFKIGDDSRTMHVHRSHLPTGPVLLLSMGRNEQAIKIMRTVGKAIGGILEENDCNGTMEVIHGHLSDEDGLQYFLKWAVITNRLTGGTIKELNQAIHEWHDKIAPSGRGEYGLYPKEG